ILTTVPSHQIIGTTCCCSHGETPRAPSQFPQSTDRNFASQHARSGDGRNGSLDEIANAIPAARDALLIALRLGKVSIAERSESCGAVRYDLSTHIFFDR